MVWLLVQYRPNLVVIITASGNTAKIDFSGLSWSCNGSDNMLMFEPDLGDTGIASIFCAINCGIGDT